MRDEPRQATTFCPRCGKPIVWARRPRAGSAPLAIVHWECYCNLTDREWAALGLKAAMALDDRGDAGERDERR